MDLSQTKLTLSEWNSIEIPVSDTEKSILNLIVSGVYNPEVKVNDTLTLLNYVKISKTPEMEYYLFHQFFIPEIQNILASIVDGRNNEKQDKKKKGEAKYQQKQEANGQPTPVTKPAYKILPAYKPDLENWLNNIKKIKVVQPNKANIIRLQQTIKIVETNRGLLYEFVLLDLCKEALQHSISGFSIYTLVQLQKYNISNVNSHVANFVNFIISLFNINSADHKKNIFHNSHQFIEKNKLLIKYEDKQLYSHQNELFKIFTAKEQHYKPCLVLYTAPTGTGKTLSPIGLSEKYRVIFVCVARHVGMSLAKSAISIGKRVGFAFGCKTASDIRLHNFSAANFIINKRSGGIGKVDHSIGTKVEIMICDVSSYITAMHYMSAFHCVDDIITYWDEPTITMDYDEHELHATIHKNWNENKIPKLVFSCATLPMKTEIESVIQDFCHKFTQIEDEGETVVVPNVYTINSYDCKKTISMVNKDCYPVLPHLLFDKYRDVVRSVIHIENNNSLLRYFDVVEIVKFAEFVQTHGFISADCFVENYFAKLEDITMNSLKQYYLYVLKQVDMEHWPVIYAQMKMSVSPKFQLSKNNEPDIKKYKSVDQTMVGVASSLYSGNEGAPIFRCASSVNDGACAPSSSAGKGILLTTKDAYTLTDGPTLFLADDVEKIGKFYLQQSQIPSQVLGGLLTKINNNNGIQEKIKELQKEVADKMGGADNIKEKKMEREVVGSKEVQRMVEEIDELKMQLLGVSLNPVYIPNTVLHQEKWLHGYEKVENAFIPCVGEEDIKEIMGLNVDSQRKILLILGIGVFGKHKETATEDDADENPDEVQYTEIMKKLAYNQRLFLIIASTDYIYGTNYQFCHGFIGKDLGNMTQQKIIQAIGRIGRTNIQQEYTVRFRDDDLIVKLLKPTAENKEAIMMNRLFSSEGADE